MALDARMGLSGDLETKVIRQRPHKLYGLRLPGIGRILLTRDQGTGEILASQAFQTHLSGIHRGPDGRVKGVYNFGSGKVTNAGVNLLANDALWVAAATPFATLSSCNFQAIGTGTTADAAADYYLQTPQGATNLSGTTNGYMTGTLTTVAPNIVQSVATFTATGAIAVTEWAITMSNAANFSRTATGTPTATTLPDSGAALTTTGNGLKGWTAEISATAVNTPTTTAMLLVTSNTATALTGAMGWWTLANASASTPGANPAYVVYPTAFDHRVFSVVNLANGDSFQTTWKLTIQSGG